MNRFTAEETLHIATVLDNSIFKTRQSVIERMQLSLPGNIISEPEREFVSTCIDKLNGTTDNDFGNLNFLAAWTLDGANERDVG